MRFEYECDILGDDNLIIAEIHIKGDKYKEVHPIIENYYNAVVNKQRFGVAFKRIDNLVTLFELHLEGHKFRSVRLKTVIQLK